MGLLDSEAGKRRLLSVEIPVIERYNEGRDPAYQDPARARWAARSCCATASSRAQRLPAGDAAGLQLPDGAAGNARADPAEALPAPARRADAVPVAAGHHAGDEPLGPGAVHLRLRHPGRLALAGVLRGLARDRRVAAAGSEVAAEVVASEAARRERDDPHGTCSPGRRRQRRDAGPRPALPRRRSRPASRSSSPTSTSRTTSNATSSPRRAVGRSQGRAGRGLAPASAGPTSTSACSPCDLLDPPTPGRDRGGRRDGRPRRVRRRQRARQVPLRRADAAARQAVDARRGALSGGIGGFVHWFVPGGPCYGCVASHLQRSVTVDEAQAPDYSQPGGPGPGDRPSRPSKASIEAIAGAARRW